MRILLLLLTLLPLVSIAEESEGPMEYALKNGTVYDLRDDQINSVIQSIKDHLRDPDSLQIRSNFYTTRSNGYIFVCNLISAKNSYGGYAEPIMVWTTIIEGHGIISDMEDGIDNVCRNNIISKYN
jgi:hypothetical protein